MHARQELCALDTKTMEKKGRVIMRHQYFMQKNFVHLYMWAALRSSGERGPLSRRPMIDLLQQ